MADNVTLNSGAIVRTDQDSGTLAHYQWVKLVFGPDDTFTQVTASVGLPISDAGGSITVDGTVAFSNTTIAVTNAGTFVTQINGAALTALELLDDAIATIGAAVPAKANQISGSDGTNSRIISTNSSGHVNIADGGNTITVDGTVTVQDGGGAISVDDNGGTLTVDDGGLSITVDGTVAFSNTTIAVTNVGTFVVQVDGAALTALQLLDNVIFVDDAAFTPASSSVSAIGFFADETATDSIDEGDIGIPRMTLDRKVIVSNQPHTAGGLSIYRAISAASDNAAVVKNAAGQIYGIWVSSVNAAARYLKIYNKATSPTSGDTPVLTYVVPGATVGAGFSIPLPYGLLFDTGISVRLVTGIADNDNTSVSANEHVIQLYYK